MGSRVAPLKLPYPPTNSAILTRLEQLFRSGLHLTNQIDQLSGYRFAGTETGGGIQSTQVTSPPPGSPQVQSFTYNAADRLTSAAASGGTGGNVGLESYSYQAETGVLSSKGGQALSYTAQVSCPEGSRSLPHAASAMGANTYSYDCSGSMTQRVIGGSTYNLAYDAENRLSTVGGAASATNVYDGDGVRVKSTAGGTTTVTIGSYFEWTGSSSTMKRYYEAGGSRMGMRQGSTLYWLVSDHLGSTSVTANASGGLYGRLLYKAWGEQRWSSGTTPTTYRYTGQRSESSIKLYWIGSRWYDPELGRWIQPDVIVPVAVQGVQAWDRYAYVNNSPVNFNDPSGHCLILCTALIGGAVGAIVGAVGYTVYTVATGREFNTGHMLLAAGGGAAAGALIGTGVGIATGMSTAAATTAAVTGAGAATTATTTVLNVTGGDPTDEIQAATQAAQGASPA